jgi:hypothetical protein
MGTRNRESGRHTNTAQNREGDDDRTNANGLDWRTFVAQNSPFKEQTLQIGLTCLFWRKQMQ